ncbi:hypothetical protein, partial [Methanobacterium sp. MZD130B]|jgi:hypothetical protein|uniref:hypothetical protein n=1 Tax=Methanobacterium sp. MZD130B TaxID=3394378 RepID=UPI0039FCCF3C
LSKKVIDEDKAFEQALKGKMGWKCSCALEIIDKKSSLRDVTCKKCGKTFKTDRKTDTCFRCERGQ